MLRYLAASSSSTHLPSKFSVKLCQNLPKQVCDISNDRYSSAAALQNSRLSSDIYALGMTAIQFLTGIPPQLLPEDKNGEVFWQNRASISSHLANILTKMVRYHFSQRYQNATEALQALKSNGKRYEGEISVGVPNKRRVKIFPDGRRHEGEFLDGKCNGRGVMTFPNGDRYDGEHWNDKRNGRGVYTYANGDRYEGEFRDDKYNGRGVYTSANGTRQSGIWADGKLVQPDTSPTQ